MRFLMLVLFAVSSAVSAQNFPTKPIRLVAPFAPGGALDLIARGVGQKLSELSGQPVIVENRAGASGAIGTEAVKNSPADGYTLLLGATATHGVNPALNPNLPYDPVKDFTPISLVATIPHALVVNASYAANTVQDLVRLGKSGQPLNYGSAGPGTPHHLAAELFKTLTGIQATHIPYKGSGPALADLIGGQIQFISVEYTAAEPHIKSGKLKALATATAQRVPGLNLPTVAEAGYPAFTVSSWYAIFGPAGMPADITAKLSGDIAKALAMPDLNARLRGLGTTPVGSTPEVLGTHVRNEVARWKKVVAAAGVKPE